MALRAAEQHVLVVLGEADLHTAGQLRAALVDMLPVHPPSVLVELGGLEFCDLAGLKALHDAARAADAAGVTLTFRGMSAQLSWLHHAFPPRSPIAPPSTPDLAASRSADITVGNPATGARRATDASTDYLTARARGRRGAPDGLVHAVPVGDRTRSAVCGARTWPATTSWTGTAAGSCPDCAAAIAVGTVHPFPAPRTVAGRHPQQQAQQVS